VNATGSLDIGFDPGTGANRGWLDIPAEQRKLSWWAFHQLQQFTPPRIDPA